MAVKPSNFARAIGKHKRWLRNLQRQKRELQEEQRRIEEEKAERRRRVCERLSTPDHYWAFPFTFYTHILQLMRASMEFHDIVTGKKETDENDNSASKQAADDSEIQEQDKRHGKVMSELNRNSPNKILKKNATRRQGKKKASGKPPAW